MFKTILRILALFALAMALITGVLDITRSIANSTFITTSLGEDWSMVSNSSLQYSQAFVQTYLHPLVWNPIITKILLAPSWLIFAIIWIAFSLLGRPKKTRWQDKFGA